MTRLKKVLRIGDESGAVIVVVAVSLVFLMGVAAIAIDMGMMYTARAETQRAADAAALAGASEYLDPLPTVNGAETRAMDFANRNFIRGNRGDAHEIDVEVNHGLQRVDVRILQPHDTWFARIWGRNTVNIAAEAAARVFNSSSVACVKPFALPHNTYTDDDVGDRVLIWESRSQQGGQGGGNNNGDDDEEGHDAFILIGHAASSPGVGRDIYHMITDDTCQTNQLTVGDEVPAKPGNNTLGNVRGGLSTLLDDYGPLTWTPDGPYNGFNKPDWESDPRVALIPMYDPATYTPPGTTDVTITGFIRVAMMDHLENCHHNGNPQHCQFPGNGQRRQLWGVVLPSIGTSDDCLITGNCSEINRTLQLVR